MKDSLTRRYREPPPAEPPAQNDVLRTLLEHRSVREFTSQPLPAGTLELLIAAAQSASTSSNKQFWSVVAVQDPERKARLASLCAGQKKIVQAPLLLVWLADLSRIKAVADRRSVELHGLDYLESFLVATVDATLAAQNAAVAAESMGLGMVYIGAMRNHPEAVAGELGLPPKCMAVFGMCVGYPSPSVETSVKPRLPQAEVLHRERFDAAAQAELLERYDIHAAEFRAEQQQSATAWTSQIMERVRTVESLHGRHRLREALNKLGFPLL